MSKQSRWRVIQHTSAVCARTLATSLTFLAMSVLDASSPMLPSGLSCGVHSAQSGHVGVRVVVVVVKEVLSCDHRR